MPRVVDADKVAEAIAWLNEYDFVIWHDVMECINKVPTVDAETVRHGRWRPVTKPSDTFDGYRCSECNELVYGKTNYCPNCGAKMDEAEE